MVEAVQNTTKKISKFLHIDWVLFFATIPILGAGLITMSSFYGQSPYFMKQLIWIGISFVIFFTFSFIDFRFLKRTSVLITLFAVSAALLALLFAIGHISRGAQSWFRLGLFSIEPSDPAQIILILILAKYFSLRHIEIANVRHIFVSGFYSFLMFVLILIQPNFGAAIIIFLIWMGMVLVSGISKRHFIAVILIGALLSGAMWTVALKSYQKNRIKTFLHPLADIHGAGYNAYQSTIAVGSGQILGKGIGYGTQSKLKFLPEYQTDFIFAAYSEEWGFVGTVLLLIIFAVIWWRILKNARYGASNFETLYAIGVLILFASHFAVNVGMNIGIFPVTGVTVPFMSYGGSHLITEYTALGILMGMRRYRRNVRKDSIQNEFLGI